MFKKLYDILLYLTNNEEFKTRKEWLKDERHFDVIFFCIMLSLLTIGVFCFCLPNLEKFGWICMIGIEFIWAADNLRHNREDDI